MNRDLVPDLYREDPFSALSQVSVVVLVSECGTPGSALQVSATSTDHPQAPSDHGKHVRRGPMGSGGGGPQSVPDLYPTKITRGVRDAFAFLATALLVIFVAIFGRHVFTIGYTLVGWLWLGCWVGLIEYEDTTAVEVRRLNDLVNELRRQLVSALRLAQRHGAHVDLGDLTEYSEPADEQWCPHPLCHDHVHLDIVHSDERGRPFTDHGNEPSRES